jgi:hypothetical protein
MKFFEFFDKLHNDHKKDYDIPVEKPKVCREKTTDIKEYKRMYYLQNIDTYTKRNTEYRKKQKELKNQSKNEVI